MDQCTIGVLQIEEAEELQAIINNLPEGVMLEISYGGGSLQDEV